MSWSGVIGDAEALLASSRGGSVETVRHAQRLLGSLRAACSNTASHAQLASLAERQQALSLLVPALARVQALGRSEPAALVAMRSLFLDLLPRLMLMPTEDGSVLQAAVGGDVGLYTHAQAAALAVSAPLLKLMLPLAASCLPVMTITGGPAPLLTLAYDVCRDSTTHGVVGPAGAETRLHVLAAMEQAVDGRLKELGPDDGDQALELWPPEALSMLSFSALHDQAVTVRRSAMRLFSLVALPAARAAPLVRLLVTKMRDTDGVVSSRAIGLMLQLELPLLAASFSIAEWADVLRYLLLRLTPRTHPPPPPRASLHRTRASAARCGRS